MISKIYKDSDFEIIPFHYLGQLSTLNGEIEITGDFYFEGQMKGTLKLKEQSHFILSCNGRFDGTLHGDHISIEGDFKGEIHSSSLVTLKPSACMKGNIYCQDLKVSPGAVFEGKAYTKDYKKS